MPKKPIKILLMLLMMTISPVISGLSLGSEPGPDGDYILEAQPRAEEYVKVEGLKLIAESDALKLFFDESELVLTIEDKRNGKQWSSCVYRDIIDSMKTSTQQKDIMRSLFTIRYTNKNTNYIQAIKTTTLYSEMDDLDTTVTAIDNGIKLDIRFVKLGFGFTAYFYIKNDSLYAGIEKDSIVETKANGIISIEMLPFLLSALPEEDGYFLYPDGSGAIHYFKDGLNLSKLNQKNYVFSIFGPDNVQIQPDGKTWNTENETDSQVYLPVFGISKTGSGVLGLVDAGASDAQINVAPAGAKVNMAREFCSFTVRRFYNPLQSSVSTQGTAAENSSSIYKIDIEPIQTDKTVRYIFLTEDNCDYSGMAAIYRDVLKAAGKLNKSSLFKGSAPFLLLDVFMGTKEKSFPFDKFVEMTSFANVKDMLGALNGAGIYNIAVNLLGWSKGGYGVYPQPMTPEKRLGGQSGLFELISKAREAGACVFLNVNLLDIRTGLIDFNIGKNRLVGGNGITITNELANRYYYSPGYVFNEFVSGKLPSFCALPEGTGISLETIGSLCFNDYNKKYPASRAQVIDYWRGILKSSEQDGLNSAVYGGNLYALDTADLLLDIPYADSNLVISSKSIPFYQMVVHGWLPYASTPVNLINDNNLLLRLIEYGYAPYYRLSMESSEKLIKTPYNYLYSTRFDSWLDSAAALYNAYETKLSGLHGVEMVSHAQVADDVSRMTYENGTAVYINYGDQPYTADGVAVEPHDFAVYGGNAK